jgi:hypothetical protein
MHRNTRRYLSFPGTRPKTLGMGNNIRTAALLASSGHVDEARAVIAAAPPATVVIEVPVTIESRGRRVR